MTRQNKDIRDDRVTASTVGQNLRQRACKIACGKSDLSPDVVAEMTVEDTQLLFHELRVHQIELQMQNEELRHTQQSLHDERERYFNLYELAPVGYCTVSDIGLILQMNLTAATLLGIDRATLVNHPFTRLIYGEDQDLYYLLHRQIGESSQQQACELRLVKKDGSLVWVQLLITSAEVEAQTPVHRIILSDITAIKKSEQERRIAAGVFESHVGVTITDANQVILQVNQAFTAITGYTAEEAVGRTPRLLNSGLQDISFFAAMRDSLAFKGAWQGEIWNRRKNGEVYPEWLAITAVKNEKQVVSHYVGTFSDIGARKAADEEILNLAFYDPLTHLPNRRLLMDRMAHAFAVCGRQQSRGAILFIDLDGFKTINDTLGHEQGDRLLEQIADRLGSCIRDGDTVARLGGDEFVVMLEHLSGDALIAATQAKTVGRKILDTLNNSYQLNHSSYQSTCSIGITLFGGDPEDNAEASLKRADLAMYQAKAAGRNALRFFEPQMQTVITARAEIEKGLRDALLQQHLRLYYQAQMKGEGHLVGVEALVRWLHPVRGLVSPADFIPLAEETGLILPLGSWVLETACTQLASWASQPALSHLTIAVNVSAHQFHQSDFVAVVQAVLERTGANPHRLKLELTESVLVTNVEDVIAKMRTLKAQGVGFSLDDFGTGYSSLAHLKRLPLDQLKIDQGFVRDILSDANDAAIAKMVIALAGSMGLDVIAEGVETVGQRDFLASQGCNAYQGYLFSRPLPVDEFEAFAAN